ncbi:MAG: hypothetical protein U9Q96_02785 [Patescibacteria group bacterium]|nr:hypothetical protein [Patescibacteria group bacterium]
MENENKIKKLIKTYFGEWFLIVGIGMFIHDISRFLYRYWIERAKAFHHLSTDSLDYVGISLLLILIGGWIVWRKKYRK